MALQAVDALGEQFQAHLAADAVRAGDGGEGDLGVGQDLFSLFGLLGALRPRRRARRPQPPSAAGASSAGLLGEPPRPRASSAAGASSAQPPRRSSSAFFGSRSLLGERLPRPGPPRRRLPRPEPLRQPASSAAGASSAAASSAAGASSAAASSAGAASSATVSSAGASSAGAGSAAAAAAASAAAASLPARSSTRSLAFSPGSPFFGLLRAGRSMMPAASRKRSTRSDGCAPTAEPVRARSASSFTRSAIVLGEQRIVAADPLDELAVARVARVGDHDLVIRPLLRAAPAQPDCNCHFTIPFFSIRHPGEGRGPSCFRTWIPAFAGMTRWGVASFLELVWVIEGQAALAAAGKPRQAAGRQPAGKIGHAAGPPIPPPPPNSAPSLPRPPIFLIFFIARRHFLVHLEQPVDLLHRGARALGDADLALGVQQVGLAALLRASSSR